MLDLMVVLLVRPQTLPHCFTKFIEVQRFQKEIISAVGFSVFFAYEIRVPSH